MISQTVSLHYIVQERNIFKMLPFITEVVANGSLVHSVSQLM